MKPISIIPLFPDTAAKSRHNSQENFEGEVAARFGLVPNFFRSAPDAPLVIRELWAFAKSAYLDTPIPTLLKERLFVYLSRFCEVRYCITRHCGFLLGLGRSAGDSDAPVMTIAQVVRLLQRPIPTDEHAAAMLARLEAVAEPIDWPLPETSLDDDLLASATLLFLYPARAGRVKQALRVAFGGEKFELLVGFLTFIRAAHYWTLMHPEIQFEDDVQTLLRDHQELARLLLDDPEAGQCEMGTRLFEELESLRDLNERQELEEAKRALEESARQKDLLIREVDHRVKNSLQIVSGLLYMQAKTAGAAAGHFHSAAARVSAIAAVHQQLHKTSDIGTVVLDRYITDLCQSIETAATDSERAWSLVVEADPVVISTDSAVSLALIVNELITNAIQHSRPVGEGGRVSILLKTASDSFSVSVSDSGEGPDENHAAGLGTRLIDALALQIHATITRGRTQGVGGYGVGGYTVTLSVPHLATEKGA